MSPRQQSRRLDILRLARFTNHKYINYFNVLGLANEHERIALLYINNYANTSVSGIYYKVL